MGRFLDLEGQKIARFTVLGRRADEADGRRQWICECQCGNVVPVVGTDLRNGNSKSCGCLRRESSSKKAIDILGRKFSFLTVIEKHGSKDNKMYWKCKCDCGNTTIAAGRELRNGHTKSCGCYQARIRSHLSRKTPFNFFRNRIRKQAASRGYEFSITDEYVNELFQGNCYFCGSEPKSQVWYTHDSVTYKYNGIDRLNNDVGYIYGNVVSCCANCNFAKRMLNEDEFLDLIEKIYMHRAVHRKRNSIHQGESWKQ